MPRQNSSHFAMRQGNRRGEWATYCGRSVRERSLVSLQQAEWIVCPECRAAALKAKADFDDAPDLIGSVQSEGALNTLTGIAGKTR